MHVFYAPMFELWIAAVLPGPSLWSHLVNHKAKSLFCVLNWKQKELIILNKAKAKFPQGSSPKLAVDCVVLHIPFLCLLFAAASLTVVFLFTTQSLCVAEVSVEQHQKLPGQKVGNGCAEEAWNTIPAVQVPTYFWRNLEVLITWLEMKLTYPSSPAHLRLGGILIRERKNRCRKTRWPISLSPNVYMRL